jgi:hypothetical protein
MWLLSRLVIIVTMQLIAPHYPTIPVVHPEPGPLDHVPGFIPKPSWDLFAHWTPPGSDKLLPKVRISTRWQNA